MQGTARAKKADHLPGERHGQHWRKETKEVLRTCGRETESWSRKFAAVQEKETAADVSGHRLLQVRRSPSPAASGRSWTLKLLPGVTVDPIHQAEALLASSVEWYDPKAAVRCEDTPHSHPAVFSGGRARWNNLTCASRRVWTKQDGSLAHFQADRRENNALKETLEL
ncbi:hypothetical protein SRHO_G00319870 [Serrasalmus rhombeus]